MIKRVFKTWPVLFSLLIALVLPNSSSAAGNLIGNGDLELSSGGKPTGWIAGRWGSNTASFSYPVAGVNSSLAAQTTIQAYQSGDAKWAHLPIPVAAGKEYQYSDYYKSNVESVIENEYQMTDGSYRYQFVGTLPPAADFTQSAGSFTVPVGAKTVSVFHYLERAGSLAIDKASLVESGLPPSPDNLIPNPNLAPDGSGSRPLLWGSNRYGSNNATFTYPIAGDSGTGVKVSISSYSSGDAKWYHSELPVSAGEFYEFSDHYRGTAPSYLGIQFRRGDGSYIYPDLGNVSPESNWQILTRSFSVPAGAVGMIVYHAVKGSGTLETSNFSLRRMTNDPTKFSQGMLTIAFDDGELSAYQNTISVLNPLGLKSTHFIVSNYLSENYTGYIKPPELLDLASRGNEIGAHTRSHRDLTKLSVADIEDELVGSKNDLEALGVPTVKVAAYPFGAYNQTVEDVAQAGGFIGARSTNDGQNFRNSDKYALMRVPVNIDTTVAQVKNELDKAVAHRSWLVLVFHHVDNSGTKYSTTPETFRQIASTIKQSAVKVVSMAEALTQMQ